MNRFFFITVNSTAIFIHFEYFTFKKSKVYNKATMYFEIHHVLKIAHFHTAHGYLNFCTWSEIQRAMENYNLSEAVQHTIASSSSPLLLQQHLGCHAYVQDPYHILGHVFMAHWSFPSNIQISHSFLSCMCREGERMIVQGRERMIVQDRRCLSGHGYCRDCHHLQHCFDNIASFLTLQINYWYSHLQFSSKSFL